MTAPGTQSPHHDVASSDDVGPDVTIVALAEALERDALALLDEYDAGSWQPSRGGQTLADGLARSPWDGTVFRAALRDATDDLRQGRLIDVLDPAVAVLEAADTRAARPALLALRHLMDAVAD